MTDNLIHTRKTIMGIDLSFGKTTTTGCGKRRAMERTSTDLAVISCPACRDWRRQDELEMAGMAEAAASAGITESRSGMGPDEFRALAAQHRHAAETI